jgi:two-component system sensor histidine kinase/response regulator
VKPVVQRELRSALAAALDPGVRHARATVSEGVVPTPLHLLLAEDIPVNQLIAVALLKREGHTVTVVDNGAAAVAAAAATSFDAILMDVQMPHMSGLDATAAIRVHERLTGLHVPIIALTAHAMQGDRERCLQAGMDDYISKPIGRADLNRALGAYMEAARHRVAARAAFDDEPDSHTGDPALEDARLRKSSLVGV